MKPLAEILDIYPQPLTEGSVISMEYGVDPAARAVMYDAKQEIDLIISQKRQALDVAKIRPINLSPDKAEELRQAIRSDPAWQKSFTQLVSCLVPEFSSASLEDQLNAIHVPWWNSILVFRNGETYVADANALEINAGLSHSYVSQLMTSGKLPKTKNDSMSVSNVLLTSDNILVLGWRGGHRYSDTLMTVPAGSVEYHSGKNPLFETLYAEHFEETGLAKDCFSSAELLGRIFDNTLGNISLYVFRSRTSLSFGEVLKVWESSMDQREHKYLIGFQDSPQSILNHIRHNAYDPEKVDPDRPPVTTRENVGSILPPCAASLLLHYAQREGRKWGVKAEGLLNQTYRFR